MAQVASAQETARLQFYLQSNRLNPREERKEAMESIRKVRRERERECVCVCVYVCEGNTRLLFRFFFLPVSFLPFLPLQRS